MTALAFGTGAYIQATGNMPPLQCINMYVEQAKTSEGGICLQSRPGLGLLATNGAGPIYGIYCRPSLYGGDDFSVSGSTLYRGTTSLGSIGSGGTRITFAASETELLVADGGTSSARSYNGTNIAAISTIGDVTSVCRAVAFIGSLFVAVETNSARFYWSTPLNGRSWDSLDFATAEREGDDLLDIRALGDNLWLFGQTTVEVWQHTGNADLPFTRIEQIAFDKGVAATGAVCQADNSLFFVGNDGVVYRVQDSPQRISDHWLEQKIAASMSISSEPLMFTFKHEGHEFVCVRVNGGTFAYDAATQEWCEFQTNGANWDVRCAAMKGSIAYFGHVSNGKIMGFDEWDDLGVAMERRFTAAQMLEQPMSIDNLRMWANVGQAPSGVTPTVSLRYSRDAGQTWSSYINTDLGNAASDGTKDYRVRPQWRRLGMFDDPGLMVDIKTTAGIPFRVSAVKINEPGGGRSRA